MATQTRRRLFALLFVMSLAVPAVPVLASPPDHANAHGRNKAENSPATQQAAGQQSNGAQTEHCDAPFTKIDSSSGTADLVGATLTWSGSTLSYSVFEGYGLAICLKSGTKIDVTGPSTGTGQFSTSDGKNISHIGYILTEIDTTTEPPVDTEAPTDEQTPADETLTDEETPAEETPAEETPAEETPAEETPADEGTPTTVPSDNRDTSSQTPDAEEIPADTVPEAAPQDGQPAVDQQPDPQQFAEPEVAVAGLVITAPPAGPTAASVVTPPTDTAASATPAAEVAASTVAAPTVIAAPATLPFTGFESSIWAALGAAILAAGAALLLAGREPHVGRHETR